MLTAKILQAAVLAHLFSMVSFQSIHEGLQKGRVEIMRKIPGHDDESIKRPHKLYHVCSGRHVQLGKTPSARGDENGTFVDLRFDTVPIQGEIAVKIVGQKSGRYLCFTRQGVLVTRFKSSSSLCLFKEIVNDGDAYTLLRSFFNDTWYVGFSKGGKALKGNAFNKQHNRKGRRKHGRRKKGGKNRRCFYFMKRGNNYVDLREGHQPGPKMPDNVTLHGILNQDQKRGKQSRSHSSRGSAARTPT